MGAVFEPSTAVPLVSTAIGIAAGVGAFVAHVIRLRRHAAYRRWTDQRENLIRASGPTFRLQVFREERAKLEWAVARGRLRVVEDHPWGWCVEVETRLTASLQLSR